MSSLKGKDGLERNLHKLKCELGVSRRDGGLHRRRLKGADLKEWLHAFTNVDVEYARISPYLVGHYTAVDQVCSTVALVAFLFVSVTHGPWWALLTLPAYTLVKLVLVFREKWR